MASDEVKRFTGAAGVAFLIIVVAHASQFIDQSRPGLLLACNLLVLITLSLFAVFAQRRAGAAFNSAVAAETIVAFGVLALILGLVTALVPLMAGGGVALTFDAATLQRVGYPFAQGLTSAGLAPVFAVLVRINGARYGVADDEDQEDAVMAALRAEVARLATELEATRGAAAHLRQALVDTAAQTARIAPDIAAHLNQVALAVGQASLATGMGTAAQRVTGSFGDMETRFTAVAAAARTGEAEVGRLAGSVGKLSTNADEFAGLLDTLSTLTASVESFLARRQAP